MRRQGGVIRRDAALAQFPVHVVDDALRAGLITLAHPGVYRLAGSFDKAMQRRAALAYCQDGALSHTDALDVWGLPAGPSRLVHLTVGPDAPNTSRGVHLHRRLGHHPDAPAVLRRGGLRVVRLEQAVIESWPLLPLVDRRAPAIVAVRERRTTPERLLGLLESQPTTRGIRDQRRLFALLAAGNHSELEVWGHERVFSDPRLPRSVTQHRLQIGSRVVYLDRAFVDEMVAVELDGAAYHGSPSQREFDNRRDAGVAKLGWLTVRYSHPRLHADPDVVVEELLTILERRRKQLRIPA